MDTTTDIRPAEASEIKGTPFYGAGIAFLSSLCCLLPLMAVLLGFGGLPFLLKLTTLRPYFIGFSLIVMAGVLWWTWSRNRSCCTTAEKKRRLYFILAAMTAAYLVVFAGLSLVLPSFVTNYAQTAENPGDNAAAKEFIAMTRLDVTVEGMSCPTCPATIRSLIMSEQGVKDARFSYPDGKGYVVFDESKITKGKIIEVLAQGGYQLTITRETAAK